MEEPKPHYDTVYLAYHDEITVEKTKSLMEVCSGIINQADVDELYFLFSSGGGAVDSAVTLYNFLKGLPVKITMHNIGSIDSAANIVFMAGSDRFAAADTSFLFHGVSYTVNNTLSKGQLEEILSIVSGAEDKIANILASNSSLTEDAVRRLFDRGESKPASFALDKGVLSEVKDITVPDGAPLYTINAKVGG